MSRDINDSEIKVTIRVNSEEKKNNSNNVSGYFPLHYRTSHTFPSESFCDCDIHRERVRELPSEDYLERGGMPVRDYLERGGMPVEIGNANIDMYRSMINNNFRQNLIFSTISYLLPQLNTLNFEDDTQPLEKNPDIKIDIVERKCSAVEVSKECGVCLEKFKEGDMVSTIDCFHTFHYSCIDEWGKYKQECPLCRYPIPTL